ncbi:GGDEF domain-containing protein [Rhizobium sp. LjRoot30]|uniref:GGDEF domain-containing protein n=1 Tax=Rhizobium sp. LjRoot30 TaxID=3342320 RepID=UPI003ECFC3D7
MTVVPDFPTVNSYIDRLARLSRGSAMMLSMAALLAVAALDYWSAGWSRLQVCYASAYIIPIAVASFTLGRQLGLAFALAAATVTLSKGFTLTESFNAAIWMQNAVPRIAAFAFVTISAATFRRSYDAVLMLAASDRMTGALNRAAFHHYAPALLDATRRQRDCALLLFIDLDDFKSVNDRHGHEAGDRVLQLFGSVAGSAMRRGDCLGRIGGDEFAALIPTSSISAARQLAAALHERFTQALHASDMPVTCSVGALVATPENADQLNSLLRRADNLMYQSKKEGKNAFVFDIAAEGNMEHGFPEDRIGQAKAQTATR